MSRYVVAFGIHSEYRLPNRRISWGAVATTTGLVKYSGKVAAELPRMQGSQEFVIRLHSHASMNEIR
jgi:hypothetical protein